MKQQIEEILTTDLDIYQQLSRRGLTLSPAVAHVLQKIGNPLKTLYRIKELAEEYILSITMAMKKQELCPIGSLGKRSKSIEKRRREVITGVECVESNGKPWNAHENP